MEIARLVLEYLQALLWPGITVTAILIFRKQLRALLANIGAAVPRLKKFTAPGTTVELIAELSHSTDQVIAAEAPKKGLGTGTGTLVTELDAENLDDLATGKIVRIWAEIDSSLEKLYYRQFPDKPKIPGRTIFTGASVAALTEARVLPEHVGENLMEARHIREQVVQGKETLPLAAFDDYLRTISKLRDFLIIEGIAEPL